MNNMTSMPMGIYLENEKRFEFDFIRHLLKISFYKELKPAGTIVSPFRVVNNADDLYFLIHNYDRSGERRIKIESIGQNELVINHENASYVLNRVA